MEITTIHLMRHGEVDNPGGLLYGRLLGFGLTDLGKQMAQTVADYLVAEDADITHVFASPLQRAQESARPTALAYDLPVEVIDDVIEAGSHFEGIPINRNRWALAHPRNWRYYTRLHEPSWGEPYLEIVSRMSAGIREALAAARGHEALVVSHQLPIVTVQRFLEGKPLSHNPLKRRCSLASLSSLRFQGDTLIGWSYAEPAASLLSQAQDVSPGSSEAVTKR